MNDTQKDALNDAIYAYEAARTQATAEFDAFWDAHWNTASGPTCDSTGPCPHSAPQEPESEDDTARKAILAPVPNEDLQVSFGRWLYLLGKAEEADDAGHEECVNQLDSLLVVAYRLYVLNYCAQGPNRTEDEADLVLAAFRKDAEL